MAKKNRSARLHCRLHYCITLKWYANVKRKIVDRHLPSSFNGKKYVALMPPFLLRKSYTKDLRNWSSSKLHRNEILR